VPGLVQTEEYARAVIRMADELSWKKKAMSAGINLYSSISAQ
jgi:hypothetical protein